LLAKDVLAESAKVELRRNSPATLSLVELKSHRDLSIFRKIYDHSVRIGENAPGWEMKYATEFHMTGDSKYFPPREQWEARGFKPDVFGRWIGPGGAIALPLLEGSMISHFDPAYQGWLRITGEGDIWAQIACNNKAWHPRFLIDAKAARSKGLNLNSHKLVCRSVARNTLTRTMTVAASVGFPGGHSLFTLTPTTPNLNRILIAQCVLNSISFDFMLRTRLSGLNLSWFVIADCPFPTAVFESACSSRLPMLAARLGFIHRRFAPEWLRLKRSFGELDRQQWKVWWAIEEGVRLRMRVEIEAMIADSFKLDPDEFAWIVRDDPRDAKGFYRVDRQLPFRERLTGLAAAAFRALKDGRWSADTVGHLSNDEFFDLLGIPELTNPDAAHAKNLSGPLIHKRPGCHVWRPEDFTPDDPRHGWTWDHCWQDAIALLGSEEAVREYIEGKREEPDEAPPAPGSKRTDLFGNPIATDLFGFEIPPKKKRKR
jgi:hypothetical protein